MNNNIYFNKKIYKMEYNNNVLLLNDNIGQWIKIPESNYKIINEIVNKKIDLNLLTDLFESKNDYMYINSLIKK